MPSAASVRAAAVEASTRAKEKARKALLGDVHALSDREMPSTLPNKSENTAQESIPPNSRINLSDQAATATQASNVLALQAQLLEMTAPGGERQWAQQLLQKARQELQDSAAENHKWKQQADDMEETLIGVTEQAKVTKQRLKSALKEVASATERSNTWQQTCSALENTLIEECDAWGGSWRLQYREQTRQRLELKSLKRELKR